MLNTAAWNSTAFCDWYIASVLPIWINTYARLTGLVPFSVGEAMIVLGVLLLAGAVLLGFITIGILIFSKKGRLRKRTINVCKAYYEGITWVALSVFVLLTLNCFLFYHATDLTEKYELDTSIVKGEYNLEELAKTRNYIVKKCNELSVQMPRDTEGNIVYSKDMQQTAIECMQALGEDYEQLSGYYPRPKEIYFSGFLSQQHMQGYYFPFSMEANFNKLMKDAAKPATMCHELAHLKGFIQEDEANMLSYLACINSDDLFFQYSGYLSVLNYLDNDYYDSINRDNAVYLSHIRISRQVRTDNEFLSEEAWEGVEEKAILKTEVVDKVSNQFTDTVLVLNGVEDGTLSYSRVVGLLMDYYSTLQVEELPLMANKNP